MAYERVNWENLPSTKTPINQTNLNKMNDAIDQNANNIGGKDYDATSTYDVGDIVKYQGQLYICTTAITTAEAWNSNHWQATDVLSSAEVVDTLSGNEANRAPSVRAVNEALKNKKVNFLISRPAGVHDFNDIKTTGLYYLVEMTGNVPTTSQIYQAIVIIDNNYGHQIAMDTWNNQTFIRKIENGNWSSWEKIH